MVGKKNQIKSMFYNEARQRGWEVYARGYPDFVIKKGDEIVFIKCKSNNAKRVSMSHYQIKIKELLEKIGSKYKIYRGNWSELGIF